MSNETARLAREWAEFALTVPEGSPGSRAAAEYIMATTSPLTMADVEWDDEKHHLAGATAPFGDEVVMMWYDDDTDHIFTNGEEWPRDRLTPNGKKYELREVGAQEEPARPATLVTEQDYENAPEGTIVNIDGTVAIRGVYGWICTGEDAIYRTRGMFDQGEGEVIRWGWGK